jgi:hypothetical protein
MKDSGGKVPGSNLWVDPFLKDVCHSHSRLGVVGTPAGAPVPHAAWLDSQLLGYPF